MNSKKSKRTIALGLAVAQFVPLTMAVSSVSAFADEVKEDTPATDEVTDDEQVTQEPEEDIAQTYEGTFFTNTPVSVTVEGGKGEAKYIPTTHTIEYKLTADEGKTLGETCDISINCDFAERLAYIGAELNFDDNGNCTNVGDDFVKLSVSTADNAVKEIFFRDYEYDLKPFKSDDGNGFKLDWSRDDIIISKNGEWNSERPDNEARRMEAITFKNIGTDDFTPVEKDEAYEVVLPKASEGAHYKIEYYDNDYRKGYVGSWLELSIVTDDNYAIKNSNNYNIYEYYDEDFKTRYYLDILVEDSYLQDGKIVIPDDVLKDIKAEPCTMVTNDISKLPNTSFIKSNYFQMDHLFAGDEYFAFPIPKRGFAFADDVQLKLNDVDMVKREYGFDAEIPEFKAGEEFSLTVSKDAEPIEGYAEKATLGFEIDKSEVVNGDKIEVTTDLKKDEKVSTGDWVILTFKYNPGCSKEGDFSFNNCRWEMLDYSYNNSGNRVETYAVQIPEKVEGDKYVLKLSGSIRQRLFHTSLTPVTNKRYIVMKGERLVKTNDWFAIDTILNVYPKTGTRLTGLKTTGGVLDGNEFTVDGSNSITFTYVNRPSSSDSSNSSSGVSGSGSSSGNNYWSDDFADSSSTSTSITTSTSTATETVSTVSVSDTKSAVDAVNSGVAAKDIKVSDNITLTVDKNGAKDINTSKAIAITENKAAEKPPVKADNSSVRGEAVKTFTASNVGKTTASIALSGAKDGEFANLYRIDANGKSVFVSTVKISDGKAKLKLDGDGKYIVMTGNKSDLCGDSDNDGVMNANDAVALLKQIANVQNAENNDLSIADVNKDGKVNVLDAVSILKLLAGIKL